MFYVERMSPTIKHWNLMHQCENEDDGVEMFRRGVNDYPKMHHRLVEISDGSTTHIMVHTPDEASAPVKAAPEPFYGVIATELQSLPGFDIAHLHLIAVLKRSPDGYRCYLAGVNMPPWRTDPETGQVRDEDHQHWEEWKRHAVNFAEKRGRKLMLHEARMFFNLTGDMDKAENWAR